MGNAMIVFLLDSLDETVLDSLLDDNVFYRPDLLQKKPSILASTLVARGADAIVSSAEVPLEAMQGWFAARSPTYWVRVIVGQAPSSTESTALPKGGEPEEHVVLHACGDSEASAYVAAFEMLE